MRLLIILLLLIIGFSLGSALYFLLKKHRSAKQDHVEMAKALTWRIGLSLVLFVLLMMGFWLGWIQPNHFSV